MQLPIPQNPNNRSVPVNRHCRADPGETADHQLLACQACLGKAGPEIPRPKHSVMDAVTLATKQFLGEKNLSASEAEWRQSCIVIAVTYDTPYDRQTRGKKPQERTKDSPDEIWSWFVTFVLPKANDKVFTLRVMPDGTAVEYERAI